MSFEEVEGLNSEEVNALYNNILEYDDILSYDTTAFICSGTCICQDGSRTHAIAYDSKDASGYYGYDPYHLACSPRFVGRYGISGQCRYEWATEYLYCRPNTNTWGSQNYFCVAECTCEDGTKTTAFAFQDGDNVGYYGYGTGHYACSSTMVGKWGISGQCRYAGSEEKIIKCTKI